MSQSPIWHWTKVKGSYTAVNQELQVQLINGCNHQMGHKEVIMALPVRLIGGGTSRAVITTGYLCQVLEESMTSL